MRDRDRRGRRHAVLLLLLINAVILIAILGVAEFALSLHDVPAQVRYSVYPPNQTTIVKVDPNVTRGVHGDAVFSINAIGTRGPLLSPEDEIRIVAMGGSTTECFVLSLEESWPHRLGIDLQQRTGKKVWVGNIGRAGRNSRQHYFDAKYVLPQFGRIDVAILLVGINDQFNRMIQGEAFETVDVAALDAGGEYLAEALHVTKLDGTWFERLRLVRRGRKLLEALELLDPKQREVRRLLSQTLPDYYVNSRAMRAARGRTIRTLPPMEVPIAEFERNMRLIVGLLRSDGTRPVLVSQPALWRPDLTEEEKRQLWLGSADGWPPNRDHGPYYSVEAMASMLQLYNDALRRVASSEGTVFIDLAALVPPDLTTLYDDVHFNESGSARVARVIAAALIGSDKGLAMTSDGP